MQILLVHAHPSSTSFTKAIADSLKKGYASGGHFVKEIDLYDQIWKQPFVSFEDKKHWPEEAKREEIQGLILKSNEIVFIHPLWWGGQPAILKNFIDQNFTSGFAYKYEQKKPIPLLIGRSSRVVITCDSPLWKYVLVMVPFVTTWMFIMLEFCGLTVKSVDVYDKIRKSTEVRRKAILEKMFLTGQNTPNRLHFTLRFMRWAKGVLRI